MDYANVSSKYEIEEFDPDFLPEETREDDYPKLMLADKIGEPEKKLLLFPAQDDDDESNSGELYFDKKESLYTDPQGGENSPLVIYFKSINRFPLLAEEEEKFLAKRIKESEEEYKKLVLKWNQLFKKELLGMVPSKTFKDAKKILWQSNGFFHLFDDLIILEKERKKVNSSIKRLTKNSNSKEPLKTKLYKIEAEISKCIAKTNLSLTDTNRIIRSLKKIPIFKINYKKHQSVEKELRKTIREISKLSKEIKILKNQMVQANLRLVISIAKKYTHHSLALSDLIQEGNLGLIRAIDTYDYRRGHRFITYATWWIRQAMIRALDCQSRTIRTPVYIKEKLSLVLKASNQLLQEFKREPTLAEIAKTTNTSLEYIEKVMQSFKDSVSLDNFDEERGGSPINLPTNPESTPTLDHAISSSLSHIIDVTLSGLTQREREIVELRFGIGEKCDHTLDEIGGKFNLSRERIRQILELALSKLRTPDHIMELKEFANLN
jgi:RNA polymerase sigma factor (sigma-70 family)